MNTRLTLTLLCCCLAASASAAEVYKWKDAQGHVHYGDQAKQGSERVSVNPAPGEAAPSPADAAARARKIEDCGRQRDQLTSYQNAVRLVEKDALGNEKEYSEADRQKLIALRQKQLNEQCADVPVAEKPATAPADQPSQ